MSKILYFIRKILSFGRSNLKILLVFASFFIVIFLSCIIMNKTLDEKLAEHVEETANDIQALISNTLSEPEISLSFISDTIRAMILRGENSESIREYLEECSADAFKEKIQMFSYYSVYGFFDEFGEFYDGRGWAPPGDYFPKERPWYKMAVENGGSIAISPVYTDMNLNVPVMFYSRCIFEGDRLLGVIAMNVPVDFIERFIAGGHFTENSYGYITDKDLRVLVHPSEGIVGEIMEESNPYLAGAANLIKQGQNVSMYEYRNYRNETVLLFCRKIYNDWYMYFAIPKSEYYKELYDMTVTISILGLVMSCALSILLISIDKARNKADMKSRKKSTFLAVMSHEIRTPMNAIMGIAEAQLHEHDEAHSHPGIKEAFDRIYYSGSLLLQIIGDLLDLSKIESGKLEITPDRYEAASLINEVVHLNKIRFDSKPIEFKLFVDENIPASLTGDELRIKQILNNLLSNAFKYTWKGEVELSIVAEKSRASAAGTDYKSVTLVFTVSDTGQGISPQDIDNLFDEYARFNTKANRATIGTGLGLSITKNLIDMMGGEISVESELEKGSKFTVRLPQKISGSSAVLGKEVADNLHKLRFSSASQVKRRPILREHMPYGSVLLVDDVEMNLFVAKLLMRPYGLKIDSASSGHEAIDRIKNGNVYDIIFMDHMMPKMDGIEATKIIRESGYANPVVALTANAVAGQADIFLLNGFDDFVSKPIDIRALNAVLNKYIRDRHHSEHSEQDGDDKPAEEEAADNIIDIFGLDYVAGLDAQRGLDIFGGDMESYASALKSFIKNAPEIIDRLRGVTEENLPEYAVNIHGLKSISGWICADGIHANAIELEKLAKDGDYTGVLEKNGRFLKEADDFINGLRGLLKENPGGIIN